MTRRERVGSERAASNPELGQSGVAAETQPLEQGCVIDPKVIPPLVEVIADDLMERVEDKAGRVFAEDYYDELNELIEYAVEEIVREAINHAENFARFQPLSSDRA